VLTVRARTWRQDNAHSKNRKRLLFPIAPAQYARGPRGAVATLLPARVRRRCEHWDCRIGPERHAGLFAERIPLRPARCTRRTQEDDLSVLLGRMLDLGRGSKRRLGWPGARVRKPDQHGHSLRQGRGHARACPWRAAAQISDQAGWWQMAANQ